MLAAFVLAAVVSQPGTYRIDPHQATAGFELKATMHTVHGNTGKVSGEVHVVPEESGGLALTGKIEIQAATLETGNVKRDATMHDTSLDVAEFPAIALEPERFTPSGPPAADGSVSGQILGRLTIRGVKHPVTVEATLTPQGSSITAEGTFDVAWADFGIPDPSFFVVRIDPVAHARFKAAFVAAP
jgi:polyisoprenoid-binding protein YceI